MTRRLPLILTTLGWLVGCGSSVAASGTSPSTRCGPASAHTLAAGGSGRVYVVAETVYGCSSRGGSYRLGHRGSCLGAPCVQRPAVAGRLAAYGLERCGVDTCSAQVVVRRLTDGARLRTLAATTAPLGPESFQSVGSLVLKGDGAVAWIGVGSSIGTHRSNIEVHGANAHGQSRLLDSGAAIGSGSMRLRGSTITWKRQGRPITATLS